MPKTKKVTKKVVKIVEPEVLAPICEDCVPKVDPITQEFSNGDMNVLRDKINELIKLNS